MEFLTDLWLPILLSSVLVFLASSVLHMVIPIHRRDNQKLAGEDAVLEAMRNQGVSRGDYVFPYAATIKEMNSPETVAKYEQGPVGFVTILPNGKIAMGKGLVQWFLYSLLIGVFVAYIGSLALTAGAEYRTVFRVTGAIAVLGYAFAYFPDSIWKGLKWATSFRFAFDGVVYGLLTAGVFGWLWP